MLIANEIEGRPEARRMKLAIIPGFNVLVPQGKLVGGNVQVDPDLLEAGQTGCVMTWASYREKNVPPAGAIFGFADKPGMTVACTNPSRPGATGWVDLDSYWFARSSLPVPGGPIEWSTEGAAADAVRSNVGVGIGALRQRRPARLPLDPHQCRPQRQAHGPDRRRSRHLGHVHSRLGHASGRHERSMGDLIRQVSALNGAKSASGQRADATFQPSRVAGRVRGWLMRAEMRALPLRPSLSRRLRRQGASLRADRLFRGHRHGRDRLLRQLSEVHGARPLRHAARRRHRPAAAKEAGQGVYAVAEVNIRYLPDGQARRRSAGRHRPSRRCAPPASPFINESCADRKNWPMLASLPLSSTRRTGRSASPRWVEKFKSISETNARTASNCRPDVARSTCSCRPMRWSRS